MVEPKRLSLPLQRADLANLHAGDALLLNGAMYTARDAGHMRILEALGQTGELPFGLAGQTIFYAGPTPPSAGRPLGSVGPTTAGRMDFAAPALYRAGVVASIGKGSRSQEVIDACVETGSVYLCCIGGCAALLARHVVAAQTVAWDDLGTEALRRLEVEDFPCFVAVDTQGGDIYAEVAAQGSQRGAKPDER